MNTNRYIVTLLLFLFSYFIYGQETNSINHIQVKPVPGTIGSPDQDTINAWVMDFLHGGGGFFDTASIKYSGSSDAFGRYWQGDDLSRFCEPWSPGCMDEGLIISTGRVDNTSYDPSNGKASDAFEPVPFNTGDPNLLEMYVMLGVTQMLAGDDAFLEFNYTPYDSVLFLKYMFASEEYPNQQTKPGDDIDLTDGSQMHDLMGIFVDRSELVPDGLRDNKAILPPIMGLSAPDNWVTIMNINPGAASSIYISNEPAVPNGPPYEELGNQYDGFTKPSNDMLIRLDVKPCKEYNIKIAIEDFVFTDPVTQVESFGINSAVFLGKGSLKGGVDKPPWTVDTVWENKHSSQDGRIIEDCASLLMTFTLEYAFHAQEYEIGFKMPHYRENVEIKYTDEYGGALIPEDEDVVKFQKNGSLTKTIRISAVNLDADLNNAVLTFKNGPCDRPDPLFHLYSGRVRFDLVNNEPFTFDVNPKVYQAYCKETIELTALDITNGGVDPIFFTWPTISIPPVDVYDYTIEASPDYVSVGVKDYCYDKDTNVMIRIDNKAIHLVDIPTISFCKPGMTQEVTVFADQNYHDFPGYGFSNVDWLSLGYTPPQALGSGNPFTIVYDDNFVEQIYEIKYNVTDVCGGQTTDTLTVDQTGKLDAGDDFYICKGESVELVNFTPVYENDPNNYKWFRKISDGNYQLIGNGNTITVTPPDTTTYLLEIYDKCEQTQVDSIVVYVDHFLPQIMVTPSSREVCPGEPVTFEATVSANNYLWTPGGSTSPSFTVSEVDPGVYTYTLTSSSDYCIDKEVSDSYEVFPQPEANFTHDPDEEACTGEDIQFTYVHDPTGKVFDWDFGDGATSALVNPIHSYDNEGLKTVYLHVQQYICEHDTTLTVLVNPLPTADFSVDVDYGCVPVSVQFTNHSFDLSPTAVYDWTLGDGTTSNQTNPSNVYSEPGYYSIGLTVTNTERCFSEIMKPNLIQANPNPIAGLDADPWIATMDDPTISFFNLSESDSSIVNFEWDFGDGNTSGDENPVNVYDNPGDYEINLRVETANDCWDAVMGTVAITEFVKLYIPNAFTPNGDGLNDYFEIKGTPVSDWNLYIHDRWGNRIWSTHNFEIQWDGTDYSGNPVPPGTYVYQIAGTDYKLETVGFKGTVTVVR